ncbi:MAG TPA: hypothetical protein PKC49_04090 [Phycisphaerae bacterium]|nr:hypothetical protein [Phycisphaerae bacterium]
MSPASRSRSTSWLVVPLALAAAQGSAWAQVQAPDRPRAEDAPPASQPASDGYWLRVTGDAVNLRSRPDVNSISVARLDRDSYLRGVGMDGTWHRVEPPAGVFSLVSAEYVERQTTTRGVVSLDSGTLRVRVGSRVSARDPLSADVQTLLERGAVVEIVGEQDGWLQIAPPPGVYMYIAADYVERVPDDVVGMLQGAAPRVRYSESGGTAGPAERAESGDVPGTQPAVAVDMSGPHGQKLAALEPRIRAEANRPVLEADWAALLSDLTSLAEQRSEPRVAERAAGWVAQLQQRAQQQAALRRAKEMAADRAGERQRMREEIERQRRQRAEEGRPFDAAGQLVPSFAVETGRYGLRYKLQNPLNGQVAAYVEFPPEAEIDVSAAVGRYVGVWGTRYRDERAGVEIIRVSDITVLGQDARPAPPPGTPRR